YLSAQPDDVSVQLDWTDGVVQVDVAAHRAPTDAIAAADRNVTQAVDAEAAADKYLPPALETMMGERRSQAEAAAVAAREAAIVGMPATTWREIQQRAASSEITAELREGGSLLHLRAETSVSAGGEAARSTA